MDPYRWLVKYAILGAVFLGLGMWISGSYYGAKIDSMERAAVQKELDLLKQWNTDVQARIEENTELRNNYEVLKYDWSQRLQTHVQANADLSRKYESVKLQLKGTVCPRVAPQGDPTPDSGNADISVQLSEETRRAVFDLRESIIRDQEVIRQWQEWYQLVKEKAP